MKDYGILNFFVPLLIGAVDMAKNEEKYFKLINNLVNLNLKKNYSSAPSRGANGIILDKNISNEPNKYDLSSYLVGLFEGDGYITINNKNKVIFAITFNIKDEPLAKMILKYIGIGHIVKRKGNSIELRFTSKRSLCKIISLMNGKFRTPKIHQFYLLIDWMNRNHYYNNRNGMKRKLPLDNSPLINNSWLAGFIDSDGGFYIRCSLKQIICKFNLEQRIIYPKTLESYEFILNKICTSFNVKLAVRNRINMKNSYYIIRIENQNSIKLLILYLDNYPLLSSKYLDYLDWKKAFSIIINKTHFTESGRENILLFKNNMNSKRIYYNWDHLNIF